MALEFQLDNVGCVNVQGGKIGADVCVVTSETAAASEGQNAGVPAHAHTAALPVLRMNETQGTTVRIGYSVVV